MRTVDWVAGVATIAGIVPLVGIPGAIAFAAASPVLELIYWGRFLRAFERMGEGAWGIALVLTLIWTPALSPIWRYIDRWKPALTFWRHFGWACLGMWMWAVIATCAVSEWLMKPRQP